MYGRIQCDLTTEIVIKMFRSNFSTTFSVSKAIINGFLFLSPQKRGKGLRSSRWLLPSALRSQLLLPMWPGTCTMEKVRGGDIGSLSETNSSSSLPPVAPGMGEFLVSVFLRCRRFVHTQQVGGALTPS